MKPSRIALLVAAVAALVLLGRWGGGYVPQFAAWVDGLGFWGPAVYVAGYAIAVVALVPASLLTLAAGAVFGLVEGLVYAFAAALVGSLLAFLVGRHLGRAWVAKRIAGDARFAAIDRAVGAEGRKIVFLLRLSPVFPFTLLNYALGLTAVRLRDYLVASVGMLPGTLLYVYSGKLAGDLAALAGGVREGTRTGELALLAVGLLATLAAAIVVARIARRALEEATSS